MTRIRPATAADTADLVRMGLQFIAESGYRGLLTPNPEAQGACIAVLLEQGGCWVVVAGADAIVGMLGIALTPLPVSGELAGVELMWWLDPQWRRGTLGVRLLQVGEAWACAQGAIWLQMIQPVGNVRLGEFYRRRGYAPIESTWQKRLAA
ncbi:MAG TPA: GNAT family N-acetyltransferase [Methylomirabilota bacterium]|nr:GNAT family N-acetyltransferase [Methylomirabilota bacterium]